MNSVLIQCVPNFSEGRRPEVIQEIVHAVRAIPHVRLVDWSADPDHNRLVVTFVGPPEAIFAACHAACAVAVERIDMTRQSGVHPRLGALDVLPLIPLVNTNLEECAALARALGDQLARAHGLPIFLYEAASPTNHSLPFVRKEAWKTLAPDSGPTVPHPTAGAIVVGAREPLIAFNVNLVSSDPRIARTIARELRDGGGAGFQGVRALGLTLASCGQTQVSMNVTRPRSTSLLGLTDYIRRRATELGTDTLHSEVIGALPAFAAVDVLGEALNAMLHSGQVLWEMEDLSDTL